MDHHLMLNEAKTAAVVFCAPCCRAPPTVDTINVWWCVKFVDGVFQVWQLAKNKLLFTNSFKKKISVILGVSQMLLGVCLSLVNHLHFRQWLNILCDFIPQIIFLLVIFGYLCACVFAKWILFTAAEAGKAPNLLIDFINMFLMSYPKEPWYPGQKPIQICFLLLALVCAGWMLFAKPLILWLRRRRQYQYVLHVETGSVNEELDTDSGTVLSSESSQTGQSATLHGSPNSQSDVGEVFIQQTIHAIEYCLGCVSHTASYLRLWALSLAHAELSEVLWSMVFRIGLKIPGPAGSVIIFLVFLPFAFLTVSILLLMEGLSAFLHTLRLHWVEFQSKFYKGEGVAFVPFSFRTLLDNRSDLASGRP
ncbi:hypothetical protein LSAT2_019438 [Lamellibrachia satsuma]|nr:hypothetical protein LSAT2_019438 [Lamellibrachia satsuma]